MWVKAQVGQVLGALNFLGFLERGHRAIEVGLDLLYKLH
jgi:hypothetical protein